MTTGTEQSSDLSGRQEKRARSEHVDVERSMPVWQPLEMIDHRQSSPTHERRVDGTSRVDDSADRKC